MTGERTCPNCKKSKDEGVFMRRSASSGMRENGFVVCNKCVGDNPEPAMRMRNPFDREDDVVER